jgi:hypothetical protein
MLSAIMQELNYVGVMAMECFVTPDGLLINELAPRGVDGSANQIDHRRRRKHHRLRQGQRQNRPQMQLEGTELRRRDGDGVFCHPGRIAD